MATEQVLVQCHDDRTTLLPGVEYVQLLCEVCARKVWVSKQSLQLIACGDASCRCRACLGVIDVIVTHRQLRQLKSALAGVQN